MRVHATCDALQSAGVNTQCNITVFTLVLWALFFIYFFFWVLAQTWHLWWGFWTLSGGGNDMKSLSNVWGVVPLVQQEPPYMVSANCQAYFGIVLYTSQQFFSHSRLHLSACHICLIFFFIPLQLQVLWCYQHSLSHQCPSYFLWMGLGMWTILLSFHLIGLCVWTILLSFHLIHKFFLLRQDTISPCFSHIWQWAPVF